MLIGVVFFPETLRIIRRVSQKSKICFVCGMNIDAFEFYFIVVCRYSVNRVCLFCFYPKNWIETYDYEIRIADRFEIYE
jgi:hypothetical protein